MKSYMVFECEDYRFTWAGGYIINVNTILASGASDFKDIIEHWGLGSENEDIAAICLDWLEDNGIIAETALYRIED